MRKHRNNFHWLMVILNVIGWGLLYSLNNQDLKPLFIPAVEYGLIVGAWAFALGGIWFFWGLFFADVLQAIRMIWPQEDKDETIIYYRLPDDSGFKGPMHEFLPTLKEYKAREGKGTAEYWKIAMKDFHKYKQIRLYCLTQLKYYNPPTPAKKSPKKHTYA